MLTNNADSTLTSNAYSMLTSHTPSQWTQVTCFQCSQALWLLHSQMTWFQRSQATLFQHSQATRFQSSQSCWLLLIPVSYFSLRDRPCTLCPATVLCPALSPKLSVFPDASVTTARAASELSVFFEAPAANALEMATSAAEPLEVVASAAEPVGFRTCCRTCRWQGCSLQLLLRHVTNELLVCSDQGYYSFEFFY